MADDLVLSSGVCQSFIPQQWRKTKCKLCFHNKIEHSTQVSQEKYKKESNENIDIKNNQNTNCNISTSPSRTTVIVKEYEIIKSEDLMSMVSIRTNSNSVCTENSYSSHSNYTQSSSVDLLDVDDMMEEGEEMDTKERSNTVVSKDSIDYLDETDESPTPAQIRRWKKTSPFYNLDKQDSFDEGTATPTKSIQKRRTRSYRKNSSNLLQLSAMMRSSNSSLCSYTSELTDGFSDYDYDVRSITDDTDDYAEITDVIDELQHIKPEIKARVQHERKISRSKIFDLERELEGQQDFIRASEIAKDRQIKSLQREIEGLKLELSSVKAHENILALKSRLDVEGKTNCITDLEMLVKSLQEELEKLSYTPNPSDVQQDVLRKELERAHKRISLLEDEKLTSEKKLQLAEDLQDNDKELLQVLRDQLSSIDDDYKSLQEVNRGLEDECKKMEILKNEIISHEEKSAKIAKEMDNLRQKVKRRDRMIEDLEDDNVKMQQIKRDIESQLSRKELKMKKTERKISELQMEVTKCNKEIADLTGEKKLEQVRRLTEEINTSDSTSTCQVKDGEQKFINTLQERLKYMGSRAKELELENDIYNKEMQELYENILAAEKQSDLYKEEVIDAEMKINKLKQENKHAEKKIELFKRKLQKCEKDRKRALNRQRNAEIKYAELQEEICESNSLAKHDGIDQVDPQLLKLKLDSSDAKISMMEGNKSYLESKVMSLEQKLHERENEIGYLHDSLERDSGAPSQDYDRLDALERENIMLQTKLDDVVMENNDHREYINKLQDNNERLEATVSNLTVKLDQCTLRLKEVEEANHLLGREALRRNQSENDVQHEVDASLLELKTQNIILQEKVERFENIEELVEQLELEVKKEKSHKQWYADENEQHKIKIYKLSEKVLNLEENSKQFQLNIRDLTNKNQELSNDVKRLEEKLTIYGELFGQDSKLYASLKRRSYQQNDAREHDEAKIIENALSPLMEEIQEKDAHIKELLSSVKEKDLTINALNDEIELWESNISTIFGERTKRNDSTTDNISTVFNDILKQNNSDLDESELRDLRRDSLFKDSEYNITFDLNNIENILDLKPVIPDIKPVVPDDRHLNILASSNKKIEKPSDELINSEIETKNIPVSSDFSTNSGFSESSRNSIKSTESLNIITDTSSDSELTISADAFYELLHKHEEDRRLKDQEYKRSILYSPHDESGSSIYNAIDKGLLHPYKEPSSPIKASPTESFIPISYKADMEVINNGDKNLATPPDIRENHDLVEDMFEQLAQLEDLVSNKGSPAQLSPASSTMYSPRPSSLNDGDKSYPSSYRSSLNDSCVDLSGLDDLLAEVNHRRGSESRENLATSSQQDFRRISVDNLPISTRSSGNLIPRTKSSSTTTIMPSIRTTTRHIIRLGGLNRSGSLDSTASRPRVLTTVTSACSSGNNSTNSSSSNISLNNQHCGNQSTSSVASNASINSIIHVKDQEERSGTDNKTSSQVPLYKRPNLDTNKFLNSTARNLGHDKNKTF